MENISSHSLKGYCSVGLCWQFLYEVSSQLEPLHAQGKASGHVTLKHILVNGRQFLLPDAPVSTDATPAQDIWNLAAAAFELLLGSPIFNGKGISSQTAKTPVPSLPQPEASSLNALLHSCLDYNQEHRPSATAIKAKSEEELKRWQQQARAPRIHTTVRQKEDLGKTDRQWPEEMLTGGAQRVAVLLFCLFSLFGTFAQAKLNATEEQVTQKLLDATLMLRHKDTKSWNAAQDEFEKRLSQFTLMNELQDRTNDCPLVSNQIKSFGVNRIVTELKKGHRVQNSGRELLDGADVRFNYSIYEKGVKQGCTATYTMTGRSGKQVFLIIPYSAKQSYETVLMRQDGTKIPVAGKDKDGVTYYLIDTDKGPDKGETITLKISNLDKSSNAAFVVINHNYRNK